MKKLLLLVVLAAPVFAINCPAPFKPLTSPGFVTTSGQVIVAACFDPESGAIRYLNTAYIQSFSLNAAQSGTIRLAAGDTICWRNAANTADTCQSQNLVFSAGLTNTGGLVTCDVATTLIPGCISAASFTAFTNNLAATVHANDLSAGCSGTAYTLTAVDAAVTCGTLSPSVTMTAAGTYLVLMTARFDNVGATYAASRTVTTHVQRTNNTPGNIAGSSGGYQTGTITTLTNTGGFFQTSSIYTTANTNDVLSVFSSVSVVPTAGSSTVPDASLRVIKLF